MKADEAIQILKTWRIAGDKAHEALDMAIEALRNYPTSMSGTSDLIRRQDAIEAVNRGCQEFRGIFAECEKNLNELPSAQLDNSCDGCKYENADDGVLVPCGFCKRSHPDNYERRTDEQT